MAQLKVIETGELFTVASNPVLSNGVWECGDQRFTDMGGNLYEAIPDIIVNTPIVPVSVPMRQAQKALFRTVMPDGSNLLDAVNAAVMQMSREAQIDWEKATEVHRDNALVLEIKTLLGWSDTQMDELFILAAGL